MSFFGLGLHVLVALFFAVHVVRSGQPMFWLIILLSFPLFGSLLYFFMIYLPNSGFDRHAKKAVSVATKSFNTTRKLTDARAAYDYAPTAQTRLRLADALMEADTPGEAALIYEACLSGPHAADNEIKICAARAFFEDGNYSAAFAHLQQIRAADASFRAEQVSILMARTLAGLGQRRDAKSEFDAAEKRFGSFEVQVEYAIWARTSNDPATARRLQANIKRTINHWGKHTRALNAPLIRRLNSMNSSATSS